MRTRPLMGAGSNENIATPEEKGKLRYSICAGRSRARLQSYQDKMMAPEGKEPSRWQRLKDRVFLRGDTKQEAADTLKGDILAYLLKVEKFL